MRKYFLSTRSATYGFLAALPLLIIYEVLILYANPTGGLMIRVGADIWIKSMISLLGVRGHISLGILVAGVGLYICFRERKERIDIKPRYFVFMFLESVFYSIFCAYLVSQAVAYLFSPKSGAAMWLLADAIANANNRVLLLALSIGAGLYEELVFRVILVGGLYWAIRQYVPKSRPTAYSIAAVVAALVFSAVHYVGEFGDVFTLQSFTYRFLFGLVLNTLYLVRGFGIAAWSHAIYDVIVVMVAT